MLRIFVLEDDDNLRHLLCETLEDEGYSVDSATNGRQAVARVMAAAFDLLILDVRMEGMSGLDAFAMLKQQGVDIACLVITGYATEEDSVRAIRLGVGDYLRKPFQTGQFLTAVRRLAARFMRQQEQNRRERQLQAMVEWSLHRLAHGRAPGLAAAKRLGQQTGLERLEQLQVQLALMCDPSEASQLSPDLSPVSELVEASQERWDGRGPRGWVGEEIPLGGRVLRLARELEESGPDQVLHDHAGEVDPFLVEHLARAEDGGQEVGQQLGIARALMDLGDVEGAGEVLRPITPPPGTQLEIEYRLLWLRLLPASERQEWAQTTLELARKRGGRSESSVLVELGAAFLSHAPRQAELWLRESLDRASDPGLRAQAWLALWTLQGAQMGSPEGSLEILMTPAYERHLATSLPWLWDDLATWWAQQTGAVKSMRFLRLYSSLLLAGWSRLKAENRTWLYDHLCRQSWAQSILDQIGPKSGEFGEQGSPTRGIRGRGDVSSHPAAEAASSPLLRVQAFGRAEVYVGGELIPDRAFRGARNKYVLIYLACAGRAVSEDRLLDLFWDDDVEKGKRGLYTSLYQLRKALRPTGWHGELDYMQRQRDLIQLNPAADHWCDAEELGKCLQLATRQRQLGQVAEARQTLLQAASLYQGPFLDACFLDWAVQERGRWEREVMEALLLSAQLERDAGQHLLALEQTQRALALDNCSQAALALGMRSFMSLRRPEEAIRLYETAVQRLKAELDLEPSLDLFELYQRARLS